MTDTVCLYHANCSDGIAAAWVVNQFVEGVVINRAVVYNREPDYNLVAGKHLYIVDFSFPIDTLKELEEITLSLTLIDHHETAQNRLKDFVPSKESTKILIDLNYCGATLVWKYFTDSDDFPWHLKLIQDHDLWIKECEDTNPFIEYIGLYGNNPKSYDKVINEVSKEEILLVGRHLYANKEKLASSTARRSTLEVIEFDDQTFLVPVVSCPPELASLVGHKMCVERRAPFSISYFDSGKSRHYSVRGAGEFNCAKFAESLGGGGHYNAAGFSTRRPYWIYKPKKAKR